MRNPNRTRKLIPALFALAAMPAVWLAAQQTLTLQQAVRNALEKNPDLAIDEPARAAAAAELDAGKAGYLPRVDVEQSVLEGNNPVYVFGSRLTQRKFTAADFALSALNTPDPLLNLQTRVQAQQNIWDFGRTRQRVDAARLGLEAADLAHADHIQKTMLAVVEAYHSVSLARAQREAAQAALRSAEALVEQSQARVRSGLAVEADLLRSQVNLANARQQEIQARGQDEQVRAALNRLMGVPLRESFGDTAPLTRVVAPMPSEENLLAELRKRRPDYQRLEIERKQADLDVRGRKTQFMPTLGAFASWEADNPSLTDAGGHNWLAGITLRWNIYSGGGDSAQLKAARARLELKQRQLQAMESAMQLEVHRALVEMRSAEQQVAAMQAAETQSEEGLRILKNRYEAGLATMSDLLSAEAARSAARTALARAIYLQRLSFAQLEYAAGILSPDSASMR